MLVDLHCHTKKTKKGDAFTRNVDVVKFVEKILKAKVEIVAITNHNHFDYEQYKQFKNAAEKCCDIWPGIELDICGKKGNSHMIVIANPDNVKLFNNEVNKLINNISPDKCLFGLKQVYESLNKCDVIYIPHFHKSPRISEEDIEELNNLLEDKTRLFKETSDYRSLGVFANYDYSVIIGSDVQDWDNYEKSTFADLRLRVSNFKQFCLLAQKDSVIINTLLNNKGKTNFIVSPHKDVNIKIDIYNDINIIFGQKGTGKSEILKSLRKQYEDRSIICRTYTGSEKEDDFSKLLNIDDLVRDIKILGGENCKDELKFLKEWEDKSPTLFRNYVDWYNTKDNNRNKQRMRITDATAITSPSMNAYNLIEKDRNNVENNLYETLKNIKLENYLSKEDENDIFKILNILRKNIEDSLINEWSDIQAVNLSNFSLKSIKKIADKCSDTVSKPMSTGFEEFVINRLNLKDNLERIMKNLSMKPKIKKISIGVLEDKGEIFIQNQYRLLCKESLTKEFNLGIKKLYKLADYLNEINNKFYEVNVIEIINEYNEMASLNNIESLNCFLGLSKCVVNCSGDKYEPSSGERGILLLQKLLNEESDVYILDEPELGMGNSYINATILPQIIDLAKQHKTIIIATHNANIAVRTLPYMSIYRTHENRIYSTYVGNPFNDKLINIDNKRDTKNWTYESMHTLEGGVNAFYERKDIYESGNERDNSTIKKE